MKFESTEPIVCRTCHVERPREEFIIKPRANVKRAVVQESLEPKLSEHCAHCRELRQNARKAWQERNREKDLALRNNYMKGYMKNYRKVLKSEHEMAESAHS